MPNIKSAIKRIKTSAKRQERNKQTKSRLGSTRRKLLESLETEDREGTEKVYRTYCSYLDKAVKNGVIKKNNANRRKSRLALKMAKQGL